MGAPQGSLHVDARLTGLSVRYQNGSMIADLVAPRLPVAKESDKYIVWKKNAFRKSYQTKRAAGTESNEAVVALDSDGSYYCEEYALHGNVADRHRENSDPPVALDDETTNTLTENVGLERESRVATLLTTAANVATGHYTTLTGANQWSYAKDVATIESDIDTGKEKVRSAIGQEPNTIIIPAAIAKHVKRNTVIRDLIKYTQNDLLVNGDLPPTMFNMRVLIPGGIYDTAKMGQTFSGADIWGKDVVLLYVNPRIGLRTFTTALTFQSRARRVKRWRVEAKESDTIEVSEILNEKMVCSDSLYIVKAAIA